MPERAFRRSAGILPSGPSTIGFRGGGVPARANETPPTHHPVAKERPIVMEEMCRVSGCLTF